MRRCISVLETRKGGAIIVEVAESRRRCMSRRGTTRREKSHFEQNYAFTPVLRISVAERPLSLVWVIEHRSGD